jgi:HEAT repeat protein
LSRATGDKESHAAWRPPRSRADCVEGTIMGARKAPAPVPDQVDRAVGSIKAAIGRLVKFLGDDDPEIVMKAAAALDGIGPFAVGPLATALSRSASPRHRMIVVAALKAFGARAEAPVLRALAKAVKGDPDPYVRATAEQAMSSLLMKGMGRRPSSVPATGPR